MPIIRTRPINRREHDARNYLRPFAKNVYSQMGEDGIIAEIFKKIGTKSKWCVEFGAWDGVYLSNTCRLIRDEGWSAVLIEGNPERAEKIKENHPDRTRVYPVCTLVGFEKDKNSIDSILSSTPISREFDFISIDVDGNDYHIWESIVDHRPRIVAVEFNPMIPNDVIFIQDRNMVLNEGNSLSALIELGKKKDYELVCVSHSNAFFVVKEEFHLFEIPDNSIDILWPNPQHYLWSCYNGKLYNTLPTMKWGGEQAEGFSSESLQMLEEFSFRGRSQGRLRTPGAAGALPEGDSHALEVVRELVYLRDNRAHIDKAEFDQRHRDAWRSAKELLKCDSSTPR